MHCKWIHLSEGCSKKKETSKNIDKVTTTTQYLIEIPNGNTDQDKSVFIFAFGISNKQCLWYFHGASKQQCFACFYLHSKYRYKRVPICICFIFGLFFWMCGTSISHIQMKFLAQGKTSTVDRNNHISFLLKSLDALHIVLFFVAKHLHDQAFSSYLRLFNGYA